MVADALAWHLEHYPATTVTLTDETGKQAVSRPTELLFTTGRGTPVSSSAWSVVWRSAIKRAKLPAEGFTLHSLRHYFATLLIHNGASVKTVQLALGHASADITLKTYLHEWPDQLDRTRNLVDAALGQRSSAASADS